MERRITPKQQEVLKMLSDGFSSEEIAKSLGNSKTTIDNTRSNMMLKFQAKNVAHLVSIGYKLGFLKV